MGTPGSQPTVARGGVEQSGELVRAIISAPLPFFVSGDVLGSGIYALIGVMAANVGGAFWTSSVVGVGAAMLTGFAYAELITKYPHAAGAADELEADLIVIGGRGKCAMEAIVLGSVAYCVLHHASAPCSSPAREGRGAPRP